MLSPDLQRVAHIREYCANIQSDLVRFGSTFELFLSDSAFQRSVAFCVLQIGELSNGLSEEYRKSTDTDVQWNAIRGLRNIVAHAYGSIKLDILWDVITTDIPALKHFCEDQLTNAE